MFRISDQSFRIRAATLEAFVDDEESLLKWGPEIHAFPGEGAFRRCHPKASAEVFAATAPGELKHWLDLAGREVRWPVAETADGEPQAILYVFEHEPIRQCHIQLAMGREGLRLRWTGRAGVHWDGDYGADLALSVDCELTFKGVWCGRLSEAASRVTVGPFLDHSLLRFSRTEDGVSLLEPL
jgi:hypothetical protein